MRLPRVLTAGACALLLLATPAAAKDGSRDVRVTGTCAGGGSHRLELRARDGMIRAAFELRRAPSPGTWRVVVVHERRVAWRGSLRVRAGDRRLRVRRTLRDLGGPDRVIVRAAGPRGFTCEAAATLPA